MTWDRNLPTGLCFYHKNVDDNYSIAAGDDKMGLKVDTIVSSDALTMPALSGTYSNYAVSVINQTGADLAVVEDAADGGATIVTLSDNAISHLFYNSSTAWVYTLPATS
jgi:hypothetical protein